MSKLAVKLKRKINDKVFNNKLAKQSIGSFIMKVSGTFLTLFTSILLARLLGPKEFGYYTFAISIVTVLTIPTVLGLPNLVVRFVSSYMAQEKWSLIKGFLLRVNQIVIAMSVITVLITVVMSIFMSDSILSLDKNTLFIASALLPLLAISKLRTTTLRGLGYITISQIPDMVIRHGLISFSLITLFVIFDFNKPNSTWAMGLNLTATLIAFIIGLWLLKNRIPSSVRKVNPIYETRTWIKPVIPLLIAGGMQVINKNTDILMLGTIVGPEASGIYQVATKGAEFILFALIAFNMALAPTFSKLFVQNNMEKLQRVVITSTRIILVYALPVTLIFIFFGEYILRFVFGQEYAEGSKALAILSVGQFVNACLGSVGLLLNMTGYERDNAIGVAISATINVILNALLIPLWGLEGAAIATTLSIIIWNLLLAFLVYKRLNIITSPFKINSKGY